MTLARGFHQWRTLERSALVRGTNEIMRVIIARKLLEG
jgi:hypothetical protein